MHINMNGSVLSRFHAIITIAFYSPCESRERHAT